MCGKYKLLVGETDKVIENEVLNVLPSKIMHQKKVSQELSNRINVLTTLLISSEFEVERVHCPCCGSPENIDYTFGFAKDGEGICGKIQCSNCITATYVNNIKTIKDLKKCIGSWIKND